MKPLIKIIALFSFIVLAPAVSADEAKIRKLLLQHMPSLKVDSIKVSEAPGLYEINIGGKILYSSADGRYLIQGHMIDVVSRKDLTEEKLATSRIKAIKDLGNDQSIIFKDENSKHQVTIFTDIDCGYCRKLHAEMDQYLAEGISIQYLFYPRAGKGSDSYDKAVTVWCSENRNEALTLAKQGKNLDSINCENPIDRHVNLGIQFEARGTPMIVTEKGKIYPGYVPAKKLAQALQADN